MFGILVDSGSLPLLGRALVETITLKFVLKSEFSLRLK